MYPSQSAHRAVNEYFLRLPKRVLADVLDLFAEDAVVLPAPMPQTGPVAGKAAIRTLYEAWLKVPMQFLELRVYDTERSSAVEIRVAVGEDARVLEVVDVFDLDDQGRIARMAAYKR